MARNVPIKNICNSMTNKSSFRKEQALMLGVERTKGIAFHNLSSAT